MNNADDMYSVFKSAANESSISPSPYCICVIVKHITSDMTIEIVTNFNLASNKKKKNIGKQFNTFFLENNLSHKTVFTGVEYINYIVQNS